MAEGSGLAPTLADLGEWELIERLGAFAPPGQFADDAALLDGRSERTLVVNTDVLVEGVHFSDATMTAADVGWRAAAANLSDLAAMGCREVLGLTVALVAPAATPWAWVEGVYQGLSAALGCYGGTLLGGDCSGGGQRLLAVTALGRLGADGPIRRRDGYPGDALVSTGPHGLSRLGLAALLQEIPTPPAAPNWRQAGPALLERAVQAHRRPRPRLDAVAALASSRPVGSPWRVAGTDSSDGLAAALKTLTQGSGCDALLERRDLPLDPEMAALAIAEAWCLNGGEDFELVLALDPGWARQLIQALPGTRRIGSLTPGSGILRWAGDGSPLADADGSFTHFH
ncbi:MULTISPECIES: thiamine-phosphate kinase [unclassified Synechococcus]|uniref:thiamine-phosphate kinase n=1 Tax=unclassified Synechococcus TaxID=2626047 RepID=UPI000069833B|nr:MULTISPECIES: thiamine-phosphate kinase [unclassified Synechococcus]EAQ75749.1 putative thiamine monophosphate kinase [Synechococcus sp. WH 5701]WFN59588.1 thiamine-phosphate kinase [Synechococcus sp. CCFWC 502]